MEARSSSAVDAYPQRKGAPRRPQAGPRAAGRPYDSQGIGQTTGGINLEFYRINFQFAAEINLSSIASPLDKMVHEEEIGDEGPDQIVQGRKRRYGD